MRFPQRFSLSKTTISTLSIFSLFLFTTFNNHHHQAFAITENDFSIESTPNLLTTTTVHELLPKFGFPKGLLPDAVKSYSLLENGDFEVRLRRPCYVHFDYLVYYDKMITGKLKYGLISDVSGIQAKKLFLWVSISGIKVESGSDSIEFQVGFISEKLPLDEFEEIPSCKSKACRRGSYSTDTLISEI